MCPRPSLMARLPQASEHLPPRGVFQILSLSHPLAPHNRIPDLFVYCCFKALALVFDFFMCYLGHTFTVF